FSALANQITTGFLAFGSQVVVDSPPRRTRANAWTLLQQCWDALDHVPSRRRAPAAGGGTALVSMIEHLLIHLRRKSLIVLVSDFRTDEPLFDSRALSMLAARHEVIAVIPEDPGERALPSGPGFLQVRDLESGRRGIISLGTRTRERFAAEATARRAALAAA